MVLRKTVLIIDADPWWSSIAWPDGVFTQVLTPAAGEEYLADNRADAVIVDADLLAQKRCVALLHKAQLPMLAILTDAQRKRREAVYAVGADDYLLRPLCRAELETKLHRLLSTPPPALSGLDLPEDYFKEIFSAMTYGVVVQRLILDERDEPVDYEIVEVNPAFEQTTGYAREAVIGRRITEICPPEMAARWVRICCKTALTMKPHYVKEFVIPDGRYFEAVLFSPQRYYFVSMIRDITRQRNMLAELVSARKRAEASEELKNAFLMNITHEIHTPMNGVIGLSLLLRQAPNITTEQKAQLDTVVACGRKLLRTVDNVLCLSDLETGPVEPFYSEWEVNLILDEVFYEFFRDDRIGSDVKLTLSNASDLPRSKIYTDRVRLVEILRQLMDNAIKFTVRGTIVLGVQSDERQNFVFFVRDTGPGIPRDFRSMWEPASTGETMMASGKNGNGLGVGITLAAKLTQVIGGRIVWNTGPGGTQVQISLPSSPSIRPPASI